MSYSLRLLSGTEMGMHYMILICGTEMITLIATVRFILGSHLFWFWIRIRQEADGDIL